VKEGALLLCLCRLTFLRKRTREGRWWWRRWWGKRDFPERRESDETWKKRRLLCFLVRRLSPRGAKKRRLWLFHSFSVKHQQLTNDTESGFLLPWQDLYRTAERSHTWERKRIIWIRRGFRRLMNHIYIYTTSPLRRRETSTRGWRVLLLFIW